VSRVASSAKAYLLAMANITSNILGFFMVTLWIRYESLLEEHNDELVIDLRDDVSLVAEMLDKLLEGLTHLLDDGNQVPVNS
jgi:hypothetical protein